jgi:hypothetical protein
MSYTLVFLIAAGTVAMRMRRNSSCRKFGRLRTFGARDPVRRRNVYASMAERASMSAASAAPEPAVSAPASALILLLGLAQSEIIFTGPSLALPEAPFERETLVPSNALGLGGRPSVLIPKLLRALRLADVCSAPLGGVR